MKGAPMKNPNIILVLIDDLGYGDVSCMNPESKIHTENIDRLARPLGLPQTASFRGRRLAL